MSPPAPEPADASSAASRGRLGALGDRAGVLAVRTLARVFSSLDRETAFALAAGGARTYARLSGPRTDVARRNLRVAFPEWSEDRRQQVLERSFAHLARVFVELCTFDPSRRDEMRALATIEGREHLDAAIQRSRTGGVVAITGHYGSWETLAGRMVMEGYRVAVVHRARDNPLLDQLIGEWRRNWGADLFARGNAARDALRALRDGKILAMPLDQNCGREEGVFVPFLGRLACTRDGPTRIAMRTGAPVVPAFIERVGESAAHRIRFCPPVELVPEGDDKRAAIQENVRRMTVPIEEAIRRAPDQWTWTHRRWRTQPVGEPRPYPSPGTAQRMFPRGQR